MGDDLESVGCSFDDLSAPSGVPSPVMCMNIVSFL